MHLTYKTHLSIICRFFINVMFFINFTFFLILLLWFIMFVNLSSVMFMFVALIGENLTNHYKFIPLLYFLEHYRLKAEYRHTHTHTQSSCVCATVSSSFILVFGGWNSSPKELQYFTAFSWTDTNKLTKDKYLLRWTDWFAVAGLFCGDVRVTTGGTAPQVQFLV